ncbi:ankyrin repeat-containing domain protein [Apiospora saccharicola]
MAHFNVADDEKARLLQHGSHGKVLEMILLVKQLAEREKVTPADVIVQVEDAQGQHLGHHCARGGTPNCRAALMRCLAEFTPTQKGLRMLFLNARDQTGNTPLMVGARQGHIRMFVLLVSKGVLVNTKNDAKETVLHQAVHSHSIEMLDTAIRVGADVDAGDAHDRTSLHYAAVYNDLEACKMLIGLGKASLVIKETHGHTVLHIAAKAGHFEIASAALAAGAEPDEESKEGATALLHLAAAWGHPIVVSLLSVNGANVNAQDSACRTPLHAAATSKRDGTLDCIKTLLASGHVKPELKDRMWNTAEELAYGRKDVLALFKAHVKLSH